MSNEQRVCEIRDLGQLGWAQAYELQRELCERRKRSEVPDQLLFVEHPHVLTLGRNAHLENVLASPEMLARAGVEVHSTNRGGDVTYHGPGQLVGYPIFDLREWKRDVGAYVRAIEQCVIGALAEYGIHGERDPKATGVWVGDAKPLAGPAKICAIGVHLSRWITSHGFALNVSTDLTYFRHIVPCGLTRPVTSLRQLGIETTMSEVKDKLVRQFAQQFEFAPAALDCPEFAKENA